MTKRDGQLTPGRAAWLVSEFQRKLREPITDDLERLIAEMCERNMQKAIQEDAARQIAGTGEPPIGIMKATKKKSA